MTMRPRSYVIFTRALEEGIQTGRRLAHKHTVPTEDALCEAVEQAVENAICEVFTFDDYAEGTS